MTYIPKKKFKILSYKNYTFKPFYTYFSIKEYKVDKENDKLIIINNIIFYKHKSDAYGHNGYIYDYFHTIKEYRYLKLKKIYDRTTTQFCKK